MLVPTPMKINDSKNTAARKMATNFTQKPSLSRFIIMSSYPPKLRSEPIVYQVPTDNSSRNPAIGRRLQYLPLRVPPAGPRLDDREIRPLPSFDAPGLVLYAERPRALEGREP